MAKKKAPVVPPPSKTIWAEGAPTIPANECLDASDFESVLDKLNDAIEDKSASERALLDIRDALKALAVRAEEQAKATDKLNDFVIDVCNTAAELEMESEEILDVKEALERHPATPFRGWERALTAAGRGDGSEVRRALGLA